jgi:hypothetical protein
MTTNQATSTAVGAVPAAEQLTRISMQEVEGNLYAVNASGIVRLTCGRTSSGAGNQVGLPSRTGES